MTKRNIIITSLILVAVLAVAYFYYTNFYSKPIVEYKTYAAEDFSLALDKMNEETLQISLDDLNKQYQKLTEDDHIYIRWNNIGILKKRLKDYDGAIEAWENAISTNPDQYLAFGNLADLYLFDLGEYEKAEEYYLKVLKLNQNNYTYYHGIASLYRYNLTDRADRVEYWILEGAKNNPSEAESYYLYLANYFAQEGKNITKARFYSQKTLELDPGLESQLPDF